MNENRLTWDELFIAITTLISTRGSCDRLRTACVLVKNNRIVGTGYNGAVAGMPNCDDVGHLMVEGHCLRTIHGERNAIHNAVAALDGAVAYVVGTPCLDCVKDLLQNGVNRIVHVGSYANAKGREYAESLCCDKGAVWDHWANDPNKVLQVFIKAQDRLREPGGFFKDVSFGSSPEPYEQRGPDV